MASSPPNVRVGVGAFIVKSRNEPADNPKFLVGKRLNAHGAGSYALPGGHLEFSETPEECAARELMEETGVKVVDIRFLTATNDYMQADKKHYITLLMVCVRDNDSDEPQVLEPDKCEGWEWMEWKDLITLVRPADEAEGKVTDYRKLFMPLTNLVKQRPGIIPNLL